MASQVKFIQFYLLKLHKEFKVKLMDDLKMRIKVVSQNLFKVDSNGQGLIGLLYKITKHTNVISR